MEIFVDADACPVKESVIKVAQRYSLRVYMVSNHPKRLPELPCVVPVVVEKRFDAVDDWIASRVSANDLVVTNDILLAERCIKSGALAIDPRGKILDENNIGEAVSMRELLSQLREQGELQLGPKGMKKKHHSHFLAGLDQAIQRLKKRDGKGPLP